MAVPADKPFEFGPLGEALELEADLFSLVTVMDRIPDNTGDACPRRPTDSATAAPIVAAMGD